MAPVTFFGGHHRKYRKNLPRKPEAMTQTDDLFDRRLLAAPSVPSARVDIYSGVARLAATVWASEVVAKGKRPDTALVFVHPTANFLGHYALKPMAERGFGAVGLTTRYVGGDSSLNVENCLLDIGAMVSHLRQVGYEKIVLVGNSGGASVVPYYQAQAENPTITSPPGGGPDLTQASLEPADAIIMLMAHSGRARLITEWLDPAIIDESNPFVRDPDLDMFDPSNTVPYGEEWMARYRAAQIARNRRISAWAEAMLRSVQSQNRGGLDDFPFVVHGTYADPRILDATIEPSDRNIGTALWGDPEKSNYFPAGIGRYTSVRTWLNQWSLDHALGDSLRWLPQVEVPINIIYGTADTAALPAHALDMYDVAPRERTTITPIPGATHYFAGQPDLLNEACDAMAQWIHSPKPAPSGATA
jgi:pimeloyl-ACP methyl ester carboxylesterase